MNSHHHISSAKPSKKPASVLCAICNFHPCARLRCKQAGLLLLALRWPPCMSTGVLGSGPAFAARLIGGIPKFGHVSQYMLDVLHWLPAEQRISYRIASLVWRCLVGLAPVYLGPT